MRDATAARRSPLTSLDLTFGAASVTLDDPGPAGRFILRGGEAVAAQASAAVGFDLPRQAGRSVTRGHLAALWLGPDEWLLLAAERDAQGIIGNLAQALAPLPHSLVDVGHRDVALVIRGPGAEAAINAGCPLDLHPLAFPVGTCMRTLFGKAEIIVWRTGLDIFRIETGRSFIAYVHGLLRTSIEDLV